MTLQDVQQQRDHRQLPIDEVGISGIRYPVVVWDRQQGKQETVAEFAMSVDLSADVKGAHLSRFVEVLHEYAAGEVAPRSMATFVATLRSRLHADRACVEIQFPFFVRRSAPVSGAVAVMDYQCTLAAHARGAQSTWSLTVRVPVTSVCPCSKAISDYGAHNQRGYLTIDVQPATTEADLVRGLWIDDLIDLAEASASAPVRPLVKRPDERHLTMMAFDNPVFVEDMVRNVADALRGDDRVTSFFVEAVNDESIHNHAAYARIRGAGGARSASTPGGH